MVEKKKEHVEVKNRLADLLEKPHPDVDYLKQQDISLVLSKGLSETFKATCGDERADFEHFTDCLISQAMVGFGKPGKPRAQQ